jgi:serine/threonine protein kinase
VYDPGSVPRLPGYRIKGELARSGTSVVHLAEDERLGRRVVVKSLREQLARDDRFRERFLCEARVVAGLDHPHVVPVYAVGDVAGALFVVMPYIRGGDLQTLLDQHGRLGLERTASIVTQTAQALDHVHARGVVHRDVEPKNILLDSIAAQRAYLCDFGITTACECPHTGPPMSLGSAGFRAPEQIAGRRVDHRADVYSLACVLHACLTAAPPGQPAPPLPPELARIVARGMATNPADRYQSCGDLAAALALARGRVRAARIVATVPPAPAMTKVTGALVASSSRPPPT